MKLHTWLAHFSARRQCSALLPWDDAYLLSAAEKARIAASIQQFQLGEARMVPAYCAGRKPRLLPSLIAAFFRRSSFSLRKSSGIAATWKRS